MHNRQKGKIGEDVSSIFLEKKGFVILSRNYQKKWGELDIVAEKNGRVHFFEVKSIQVKAFTELFTNLHRPEENVHGLKVRHIKRMIEQYLDEMGGGIEIDFSFHILCVFVEIKTRRARVKWIENVIL